MTKPSMTYKDAGVDIEAGDNLVEKISPLAKMTNRAGVMGGIGGFGGLFDLKALGMNDPILVSGTDGVGTKLKIAIDTNIHNTVGIDLVAMCVNDVLVQGAFPLFFMDYFATGKLDVDTAHNVISGITEGCLQSEAALLGGETAEMPDFYPVGHYDLAGFCVGAVERDKMLPRLEDIKEGDELWGLDSSGFHSNGYSLVRRIVEHSELDFKSQCPWDESKTLGEALLTPTKIYVKDLKAVLENDILKALCHITGGGLTENLPRIMPENLACKIDLSNYKMPPAFAWLQNEGNISLDEMLKTFNCGIGMVLIISCENRSALEELLPNAFKIGEICKRVDKAVEYI